MCEGDLEITGYYDLGIYARPCRLPSPSELALLAQPDGGFHSRKDRAVGRVSHTGLGTVAGSFPPTVGGRSVPQEPAVASQRHRAQSNFYIRLSSSTADGPIALPIRAKARWSERRLDNSSLKPTPDKKSRPLGRRQFSPTLREASTLTSRAGKGTTGGNHLWRNEQCPSRVLLSQSCSSAKAHSGRHQKRRKHSQPKDGYQNDQEAITSLKAELRRHLLGSTRSRRQIISELYAGRGRISAAIRRHGYGGMPFELSSGDRYDLLRVPVRSLINGWLKSAVIRGVWLSTECKSWSRALRGPPSSNWPMIRNAEYIYGLPDLPPSAAASVAKGSSLMAQTALVISTCVKHKIPCVFENPLRYQRESVTFKNRRDIMNFIRRCLLAWACWFPAWFQATTTYEVSKCRPDR